jgi:outer membrane protein TolC
MKNLKLYIMLFMVLFVYKAGYPQSSDSLNLEGYLVIAAKNNSGLKASFNEYLAAMEKVPQVGSLTDPQLTMGFFLKPMELVGGNQVADFQLMQMFPWFGTLKAAKDEASMMAKAKFEEFSAAKADLYFKVTSSWYQILKYDQEIKLQRENIALLESIEQIALIKFQNPTGSNATSEKPGSAGMSGNTQPSANSNTGAMNGMNNQPVSGNNAPSDEKMAGSSAGMGAGQSGLTDVLLVKMDILEQKNQLALLLDAKKTEEANFNFLLNREQTTEIKVADSLKMNKLSVEQLTMIDAVMKNNPMLAMLDAESQSYLLMEKKSRKMGMPMLGIGLDYSLVQKRMDNTSMMNGKDMIMPMVSVTLPIYRKKYKAMQNEAKFMYEATLQKKEEAVNMLKLQSAQLIQDFNDASRRTELYRELSSLSQKTAELLISGYSTGGTAYDEVMQTQYKVLDNGFKYIDALIDYNIAVARAEKLMNLVNFNK